MISITVTSHNGTATPSITGHFDETGGNIGRAENNQLVLPDPERTISRVHAQIVYRNGKYAVIDRGSNAISVNGRPLGNGQEAMLQIGDEISIGGYSMRVQAGASPVGTVATDPFADFGGLAGAPLQGSAGRASAAAPSVVSDPLAAFGVSSHGAFAAAPMSASAAATGGIPLDWDPFAPDPQPVATGNDLARSLGQASSPSNFGLDVGGRAEALIPDFGGSGSAGGGSDSLDALFGLSAGGGRDPLAGSALNEAAAQPNMAAHADPLKSLNSMTRGNATAAADTSSELRAPFMLPPMMPTAATPEAATPRPTTTATLAATPSPSPPHAPVPAAPVVPQHASQVSGFSPLPVAALPASTSGQIREAVAPPGSVLSWTDASGETQTVIRPHGSHDVTALSSGPPVAPDDLDLVLDFGSAPAASVAAPPPAPVARPPRAAPVPASSPTSPTSPQQTSVAGTPASPPPLDHVAAAAAAPASPVGGGAASSADMVALTAALREGLNVPNLPADALVLTPALMRLLGRLVHEATRGTVDLLVARAALKREIRAEVTMIVTRENNPLKFSPSAEVALGHLLSPPARGFMEPDRAMRDAYDDLRAHQFGFLAGMRAALEGILKRFDPARLEGKLTEKSFLASLIPAKRKARMWDAFTEMYGQISAEASDDFHELFGKEFLRAYNEHIDQLAKDRP